MNDLLTWFGLKRHPFDREAVPMSEANDVRCKQIKTSDLFGSGALAEAAARLDYIKQRGGTMLLTGDPGVGKTVALRRFVDSLNDNLYRPVYTPLATLNRFDILRHLNQKLGLVHRGSKSALYTQIQRELIESKDQRGKTVVLIIDEAQMLSTGRQQFETVALELRIVTRSLRPGRRLLQHPARPHARLLANLGHRRLLAPHGALWAPARLAQCDLFRG